MPETELLTDSKYTKLLRDLRKILTEGKARAQRFANQVLLETYWQVGKRITEEKLTERAGYGDSILEDLAEDLETDTSTLKRGVTFFELHQKGAPRGTNLTWSHYRELLPLTDTEERNFYRRKAEEEGWSRNELVWAIDRDLYAAGQKGKQGKDGGGRPALPLLKRPSEATHIYKALVERVVDADTLILRVDLGFEVWKHQRIRLAKIDAAPIDTPQGYEAFEFVREKLAKVPFVLVKTNQLDIHGRYVGDIFYDFKEKDKDKVFARGRYLNQELLERGLARRV